MKKFLRTFVMLALLAVPWITQAQTSQTFDFEGNAIPAGWTNDATYPWVVTTSAANGGTHCIKSGNAGVHNSTSSISVTITYLADGEITFAAKASCEQTNPSYDWDYGTFYIDGTQQGEKIINSASFTTYTYPVTAGQHTFVWKYKKDGSVSSNDDCLYIDDVVIAWENADCPKPLLTLGTYTTDMATVSWTEVENAEVYLVTLIQGEDFIYDNEEVEDLTFDFDELEPGTTYTVEVRSECGLDEPSNASIVTFTTFAAEPVSEFPYLTGFEDGDDVGWELVNDDTKADKWYIGSAVNNGGSKSLYISNDGGITNSYSENYDNVYAYRNFVVEEWGSYYISFDWRCYGEGTTTPYDYLTVYLAPASSAEPQAGSEPQSSWLQIGSIFNQVQTWQNFSTILDNVQPGAYRLIFRWRSDSSTQNDMPAAIDNVNVVKISCPAVASVVADEESITPYSASISWEYGGDATDFIVVNDANTEETYEVSGETSFTIEDLTPNTQYTFKVYVNCGDEDISLPANVTFRTACAPIASLPYTEDFENVPSVSNPMPYCWTKYNTVSTGTYPNVTSNVTNAHNGQKYLYFYYSTSTGQPDYVMAILPELDPDVNSITNSQLSFWARTNSATGSFTLQIGTMSDPTDPETFELAEEKTITGNTYNRYDVAFYEAPEDNVYAVIRMNNPSASAYVYVDDVTLMEIPTCAYVNQNNIEVLGTTAHSVDVSWTDEENEDANYNIYDMSGEEPVLVVEGITLEDLPYTIDENVVEGGLASSTTFHYGLAAVCGGDVITDISDFYFTTECEAISVFPWTENFDSYGVGNFNALCWLNEHIAGSATDIFKVSQNVGGNTTKVLQLPDQAIGNMTKLVLPEMILPGDNYMLTIDMYRSSSTYNTSYPSEGIRVFVSTNGEIEGATELAFIPRHYSVGNSIIPTEEAEGWYNYELPIGVEGNCYIILRGESQYCTATYMDNLTVKQIPTCRQPNALAVSEIGPHQVTLSWTERGEATEWEVSYVPVGGNQSSNEEEEVEEVVPAETNPFVLTGLDYETGYIVKVRANCGEDGEGELDLSEWSEPLTFTTAVACPGIAASSITAVAGPDYVNLTWPSNNVEDATYNVYKYIPGETEPELVGENVDLPTAEEPFVVDGLDPETQYTFGVKPICDEGDAPIATVSCTTSVACPLPEALVAEDVTATEATLSWLGLNPNASYNVRYRPASSLLPVFEDDFENGLSHWTVYTEGETTGSNDEGWYVFNPQTADITNAHSGDYVVSSWSWNSYEINADNWLVSPQVTLGTVLKYWEYTNSGYPDSYEILFSTTGNTVADFEDEGAVTLREYAVASTNGWNEVVIDLSELEGQTGYIAIHHEDYDENYLYIDDFGVYNQQSAGDWVTEEVGETTFNADDLASATAYEFQVQAICGDNTTEWTDAFIFNTVASCLPATDLAVEATTTTSVTLTWTDNNDGSAYVVTDVEDNEVSFTMLETGMGCVVTGLEPNTAYTFKVKASCGDGDYSTAVSIHTRTACTAISELPFTEGFEEAIGTRYCWTLYSSVEGNNYPTFLNNATYSHNGNTSLYIYNDGTVETFIAAMPPVNPDMISLSGKQVSFWARTYGSNGGTIQIGTMSDINNPETFVLVDEVTVTELEYERYDILLDEVPEGNIYLAVRMIDGENGSQFMIDDITLMEAPLCAYVTGLAASNINTTSIDLTWSDENNEEGTTYVIYNMNGEDGPVAVAQGITLDQLPYTVENLEAATSYTFGVAAMCGTDPAETITIDVTTGICNVSDMCEFTFTLTDAWGDGWNGAAIRVKDVETGEVIADMANENLNGTTGSGEYEVNVKTLSICNGREIQFSWVSGSFDSETSYSVTDINDDVVFSGSGAMSAPVNYTVACTPTICRKPSNLAASDIANHSFSLSWTENGGAEAWIVAYKTAEDEDYTYVEVEATNLTLTELAAETAYTVKVRGNCGDEPEKWSDPITVTTLVACPTPTSVVAVPGPTKVFVTWAASTNEDATYIIYDMSEANPEVYAENVALPTAENPYVIEGLDPETQYSFGVAANCGDEDGQSAIVSFTFTTTGACPAVDEAFITVVPSTTSATVTWVDGNSDNATYIIYNMGGEEPVALFETPISIDALPYTISDLAVNTQYTYGVQAICPDAEPEELTITSFTFTTECDAVAIPYTEEFVSIDCWRQDGNGTWTVGTGDYSTSTGSYSGTTNARITHVNTGDVTKLISPVISNAENGMRLQFAYVMRQWVSDIDELRVYYRSSATDEWNQIGEYTEAASTWTVETIDITNAVYQIAFEYTDGYGYGVGIDQVVFNEVPTYYTVNTPVNPVNSGSVTAADDVNLAAVLAGTSVTITADPATGYQFVNWTIGETTVTDNPYTFQVNEDMEITANFELIPVATYAVTLTYIQTQGSVIANVENLQEIEEGTEVSLNAVPATGYQFVGWTVGEATITDNPYVFEITADMAITANFELIPATYAVTIATVENGFVYTEYDGNLSEVLEGTEVTFIATASTGYQLAGWTVNGEAAEANEDGTLTVTIDADKTIAATFELIPVTTYNVSVNTSVGGNVNPIGNQTVVAGEGLTVTATPNTGYHFVAWMQGENLLSNDNPYTYYPEADNTSITATFEENAAEDVYYSIMASANPTEGTVSANVALGQVLENTEVSITATPNAHYEFVNWIENGVVVSTANPYTFTATADHNLFAYFNHIVYEVNLDWSPEMGTVTGLPEQDEFEEGDQFFLTATANEGYHFVNWTINNETVEGSNTMVTVSGDMTIVANFAINTYAVTVVANNGTVEANVEDLTAVNHYTQVTFTATPATGYELSGWTVNGVETEANVDGTLTITVTAPTTVAAVFTLKTYTVTLATVENGSIATAYDGDLTAVAHGTAMTFTATPAEGYELEGWTVNGTAVTANPDGSLTVSVTANITVAATFTLIPPTTYTVTIATVQNGTISTTYTGDLTAVVAGTELTFTATPAQGYELSGWTVNGEAAQGTGNTLTVTVNANITVAATFTLIPPTTYTVTIATVEHGTISANIDNLTAVVAGTEVTFTATPAQGYELSGWTVNGQAAQGTGNQLTVTVNANITVAATFTLIPPTTYTVTIATVEHGTISASIDNLQEVEEGTEVTFTATPAEGYELEGWTVNGQAVQANADGTLTVTVTENVTVAATFTAVAPATIDVTFTVNDPNMGSINPSGTQTFTVGTQVTVTATANEGYEFYGWELTVNGLTTTLTENVETTYTVDALAEYDGLTVKALFKVKVGIDDVDMNNVTIYSAEDVIYVRGAEGRNVTVFDLNGRVLNQTAKAGEVCEFRMNNTGIYLVKVGNAAAKRVAVVR